jgi:ubiquinone/menaquinone biosynthesis C-methylase UbiE
VHSTRPMSTTQTDFDRIALISWDDWDHNKHYHGFLLRHLPAHCQAALEIGCGTGALSRRLAERSDRVVALDLSPQMIHTAKERSQCYSNIEFQVADATTWEFPLEQFDCVASIATLHHLPIEEMLLKMTGALRLGGTLIVLDLYEATGLIDLITGVVAIPTNWVLRLVKNGRLRERREVSEAWAEHGKKDIYSTLPHIHRVCEAVLPGARVRRHLLWRYSIVWERAA